jgi:hypothetical protein
MSDFDLDAAIVAARQRAADVANDGTATRLRIRETLARRPDRRVRRTTIITALIATLFGSTAFAYYAGWRPPWTPRERAAAPAVATDEAPSRETPSRRTRAATSAEASVEAPIEAPIEAPAAAPPAPVVATTPVPAPARARPRAPSRVAHTEPPLRAPVFEPAPLPAEPGLPAQPVAPPPPPPPAPAPDPELAAYRVAHEAHFRGGNAAAALRAWDAYLAAYPSGTLAVDARYSRALILIKLERWTEAASALQPFASAPAGSYRQAEAARLLAALPRT